MPDVAAAQEWVAIAAAAWKRVGIARSTPARADETWPRSLTGGKQPADEGQRIFLHLLALGRLQFGVELALERLQGARTDYDSVVDPMSAEGIEAGFRVSSEIHALFVVADSFWDNLAEVVKDLPGVRGIADARSAGADIADRTRMGRDHLEHFAERIPKGRRGRPKDPDMSAAVFAQIPGGFDGRMALFGDEEFDVVVIAEAVTRAGSTARAALGHSIGRHVFESR